MAEYVHVNIDGFTVCNRCGSMMMDVYYLGDTHSKYCPDCFGTTRGYVESGEAMIMDKSLFDEIFDSIDEKRRFSSWYIYGRKDTSDNHVRWIGDSYIPWNHDRLGRPSFSPRENISKISEMMRKGKTCLATMMTVPDLGNISDDVLNRYSAYADTPILYLVDCKNRTKTACYRKHNYHIGGVMSAVI